VGRGLRPARRDGTPPLTGHLALSLLIRPPSFSAGVFFYLISKPFCFNV
jgi:hypothetical protein